jgi:hypothetical protein
MIDTVLFSILLCFAVMNLPMSAGMPLLLLYTRHYRNMDFGDPVPGRKVIVLIATVGKAFDVVQQIIADLKEKNLPIRIMVLIEEYDKNPYDCEKIIVPASYGTPNHSLNKHRALHYYSEWLKQHGYGKETYTIHIDDDNMVSDRYIKSVFAMTYPAGLGTIRLRAYSRHLLNIIAEFQRVADYDAFVSFFCIRKRPVGVNGEGLTIRADVESELGWDFGPIAAEDLLMGQNIVAHGYEFGYIPGWIYLAPAVKSIDFYKQRRRWIWHFFVSAKQVWHLNPIPVIYFTYLYAFGWLPIAGLAVWSLIIFLHYTAPPILLGILTYQLFFGFFVTQYGAFQQKHRVWNVAAILLQFLTTIYMYGVFFYFLITYKQLKQKFEDDTIEKV